MTSYLTPLILLTPRFYLLTQFRTETLGHKTGRQARTVSWTNLGEPVTSQAPELIIQVTSTQMPAATSSASSRTQAMSSLSSRPHCRAEWALYGAARPWWTEQRPVSLLLLIYRLGGWALTLLASPRLFLWLEKTHPLVRSRLVSVVIWIVHVHLDRIEVILRATTLRLLRTFDCFLWHYKRTNKI